MGGQSTTPEPPSPVAGRAQCNLIVNLIMGAVWLGLWLGYAKAENRDKDAPVVVKRSFPGRHGALRARLRRRRRRSCGKAKER